MPQLTRPYVAGFIDAKGSFKIRTAKLKRGGSQTRPYFVLTLPIESLLLAQAIKAWAETKNVNLWLYTPKYKSAFTGQRTERVRLCSNGNSVVRLCKLLLPYLVKEHESAERIIRG